MERLISLVYPTLRDPAMKRSSLRNLIGRTCHALVHGGRLWKDERGVDWQERIRRAMAIAESNKETD